MNEIVLHQPPGRPWGTPNLSPFCVKLESYLRIREIPYTIGKFSRSDAPKGKVPFVKLDGRFMGDSQLIIEELERRLEAEGKPSLDGWLTARDRAVGRLVRRTLEEAYYFIGLYNRWKTEAGYAATRDAFKAFVPGFVVPLIRRDIDKKLHAQGTGRHTIEEVTAMGARDFEAIAELLGDRSFVHGDQPSTTDCVVFAFLEATLGPPVESPLAAAARSHGNLVAYRRRIRERWWKDLPALP